MTDKVTYWAVLESEKVLFWPKVFDFVPSRNFCHPALRYLLQSGPGIKYSVLNSYCLPLLSQKCIVAISWSNKFYVNSPLLQLGKWIIWTPTTTKLEGALADPAKRETTLRGDFKIAYDSSSFTWNKLIQCEILKLTVIFDRIVYQENLWLIGWGPKLKHHPIFI